MSNTTIDYMKRFISIIALLFVFLPGLMAQEEQTHLAFKSIPIDGPLEAFSKSLTGLGLHKIGSDGEMSVLEGNFAGYKNCRIIAVGFEGNVWKVIVEFPDRKTWSSTKELYDRLKESFITKYDATPNCYERMPGYARAGSGLEHLAFQDETGKWLSTFELWNGKIKLYVKAGESGTKQMKVVLEYLDGINTDIVEGCALEDL